MIVHVRMQLSTRRNELDSQEYECKQSVERTSIRVR